MLTLILIGLFITVELLGLVMIVGVIILQKRGARERMMRDETSTDRQWKRTVADKIFGGSM